jgi:hypothetical protein
MRVLLLAVLVALAPAASAVVLLPPTTTKCVSQADPHVDDGGVTVCVDWGRGGCAVWVTREFVWGSDTRCVASWPEGLP